MSFFQQKEQGVYMFPESAALTPLNGTKVTANPAEYPWYSRINVLPDGLDWDIPIRKKMPVWDIGSGKHPSHIVNVENEPVEFTMEMMHQDARFLALATGSASSSGTQAAVWTITASYSDQADGDYFFLYTMDASGHLKCYCVYMDVDSDQAGDPSITGTTSVNIDFVGTDNLSGVDVTTDATLADEIKLAIDALTELTATETGDVVTVTCDNAGAIPHPRDSTANPTGISFSCTTSGASTHTITELTDNTLKTFGLHFEWDNGSEDIVADLFGCVVKSYEITIDYDEKIIKESVNILCPYYVVGNVSTIPPPVTTDMDIGIFPNLTESASNYVIMVGTTDKTPAILNTLSLSIENDVEYYPAIGTNYRQTVVNGKRDVKMNLQGYVQTNDLWTYWKDTWSNSLKYYTNAGGRLNSEIKVNREDTYDNWQLSVYNWMIEEYGLRLVPIDEKIQSIDISFMGATPNSSGYILDSLSIKDYREKLVYAVANS